MQLSVAVPVAAPLPLPLPGVRQPPSSNCNYYCPAVPHPQPAVPHISLLRGSSMDDGFGPWKEDENAPDMYGVCTPLPRGSAPGSVTRAIAREQVRDLIRSERTVSTSCKPCTYVTCMM